MTLLHTWVTRRERWTGSGSIGRMEAAARRGMKALALLLLDAVLGTGLLAVADAGGVERPADDLVAHARKVLDAATAHEHDGVLLQVVPLAGDVGGDLDRAGDADAGDLAKRGVRLLGRGRVDARADAAALRGGDLLLVALPGLQAGSGHLARLGRTALADQLTRRGHAARDGSKGSAPARFRPARRCSGPPSAAPSRGRPRPPPCPTTRRGCGRTSARRPRRGSGRSRAPAAGSGSDSCT